MMTDISLTKPRYYTEAQTKIARFLSYSHKRLRKTATEAICYTTLLLPRPHGETAANEETKFIVIAAEITAVSTLEHPWITIRPFLPTDLKEAENVRGLHQFLYKHAGDPDHLQGTGDVMIENMTCDISAHICEW